MNELKSRVLAPDKWVTNYADILFRYAYLRLADKSMAEDIVQETFLSAWKFKATYDKSSTEKNWLFTICKNKLIDHFRKLKSARSKLVEVNPDRFYFDENDHWTTQAAPVLWTASDAPNNTTEFFSVLNSCRVKLIRTQQAVFTMRYMDEMDAKEICRIMEITIQNYWVLIHRAKLQLRECLQRNWIDV